MGKVCPLAVLVLNNKSCRHYIQTAQVIRIWLFLTTVVFSFWTPYDFRQVKLTHFPRERELHRTTSKSVSSVGLI